MSKSIPVETRRAAVEEYLSGGRTVSEVAAHHSVSQASLGRWLRRFRAGAGLDPKPRDGPRPSLRRFSDADLAVLRELLENNPQEALADIGVTLAELTGKRFSHPTLVRAVRRLGYRRRRPVVVAAQPVPVAKQTRYQAHHRRDPGVGYPSDLTDAEWALLAPLFELGPRGGRPPRYARRHMLNAIFYVVRSGCSWRMLPNDFPPWQNAYAHFRRWSESGLFEEMHHLLRAMWRERAGRNAEPSAGIIDSQSVKTTEKGGLGDTTVQRRSRAASATSS